MMHNKKTQGFTLAEILISSSILGLFVLGFMQTTLLVQRMAFDAQGKIEITENIRKFTTNISRDGRAARLIMVYEGMPAEREDLNSNKRLADGETGDLAVFIHAIPQPITEVLENSVQQFYLRRIVAYVRVAELSGEPGPVFRYEKDLLGNQIILKDVPEGQPLSQADNETISELLYEMLVENNAKISEVVELSRGLANGRLFYFFRDNALVINGEVVQGNRHRRVTNTYNFTVNRQG